ncbi:cellulose biosynthesis protein BcsG [Spongiibacter sp. KMU-166]|uniref:Cellulose biosynthesis protein BcsG n=1 Tax=Spongiibacter thalassae TaxID=2721624 RepID=A0ABX1GF47_9GAMM|nr:cellulose biosynthesis protein BcsG [Spongiibacter thalassae]NKI17834.1 cellulose biosynthesis protein BcsG [Spongiibacter thalassae]
MKATAPLPSPDSTLRLPELAAWNFYFLAKLALYFAGVIDFHLLENLAFAAFLLLPLPLALARLLRQVIAIVIGLWLLHYDSHMPPLSRLFAQMEQLSTFEADYLLELVLRFLPVNVVMTMLVGIVAYLIANRIFRMTPVVLVAMLSILVFRPADTNNSAVATAPQTVARATNTPTDLSDAGLNERLDQFFSSEKNRQVAFPNIANNQADFDIIFLSVCSLSWDDMEVVNRLNHPLMSEFDILFEQFNSATSYSGPALLRLTRASCGQPAHQDLYEDVDPSCLLFEQLESHEFESALLMNHDGKFDSFLERTRQYGRIDAELFPLRGFERAQKAFDGTPIFRDRDVLEQWWKTRLNNPAGKVAAIYNTPSLHDGNRIIGEEALFGNKSYARRLDILFSDLGQFFKTLEASGRNVVVVMIPEHGASLRGDSTQISGMREIPTPSITHIPVGVKIIGPNIRRAGDPVRVGQASSFQALGQIVANILEFKLFNNQQYRAEDLTLNLPETDPVSQNDGSTVMQIGGKAYLSLDGETWTPYQ